jgi:hypothetical protein
MGFDNGLSMNEPQASSSPLGCSLIDFFFMDRKAEVIKPIVSSRHSLDTLDRSESVHHSVGMACGHHLEFFAVRCHVIG